MNNSFRFTQRKLLAPLLALFVVLLIIFAGYELIARPHLTITAPIGSTIIISTSTSTTTAVQRTTTEQTTLFADTGDYSVTIEQGSAKELHYVSAGGLFSNTKFNFTPTAQLHSQLVARQVAYSALPSSTSINFLDTTSRLVKMLDENSTLTTLAGAQASSNSTGNVYGMHPIANHQAIIQLNTTLSVLRNDQLTQLNSDGFPSPISSIAIGTNPNQSSFAVAINQTLYWYQSADAKPQKIVDLGKQIDQLVYGGNQVIAYSTRMPVAVENIRAAYSNYAIDPILINITAKTASILTSGPIIDASLSPSGQYATIDQQGTKAMSLYNLQTHQRIATVAPSNLMSPYWLDNTHYIYGKDSDIWKFDVPSEVATTVGALDAGLQPTSITYDPSNNSYLVTTYNSENSAAIYRLSTNATDTNTAQAVTATTYKDPNFEYQYGYVNITRPTIIITVTPQQSVTTMDQLNAITQTLRSAALDHLKKSGVDLTRLTILYTPTTAQ